MVGGDAALLERAMPVLDAFGEKIVHLRAGRRRRRGEGGQQRAPRRAHLGHGRGARRRSRRPACRRASRSTSSTRRAGRSNTSMNLFPERVLVARLPAHLPPRAARQGHRHRRRQWRASRRCRRRSSSSPRELCSRIAHGELGEEADHVEAVQSDRAMGGSGDQVTRNGSETRVDRARSSRRPTFARTFPRSRACTAGTRWPTSTARAARRCRATSSTR